MEDVKTANALLKDDYEELQVNLQQAYLHKNTLEMETSHIREQQEKQEAAYAGIHEEIAKIDADKKNGPSIRHRWKNRYRCLWTRKLK